MLLGARGGLQLHGGISDISPAPAAGPDRTGGGRPRPGQRGRWRPGGRALPAWAPWGLPARPCVAVRKTRWVLQPRPQSGVRGRSSFSALTFAREAAKGWFMFLQRRYYDTTAASVEVTACPARGWDSLALPFAKPTRPVCGGADELPTPAPTWCVTLGALGPLPEVHCPHQLHGDEGLPPPRGSLANGP